MDTQENRLYLDEHILFHIKYEIPNQNLEEINYLKAHFCGTVIDDIAQINQLKDNNIIIYVFGDIADILSKLSIKNKLYVIKELSHNITEEHLMDQHTIVTLGEVPINVHNVGVFFRKFFNDKDYFALLTNEHQFQLLTESNKTGESYRKGLYITKVDKVNDSTTFNLLRCSTNLDGPTDNFRETDIEIISKVNNICKYFFEQEADLNHVLAQVYNNVKIDGKERKAKIKAHSDKTKDMPANALMAFCTFYDKHDEGKYEYKGLSVLTKLRFRLKDHIKYPDLEKNFDIILYPGSVFIMSLTTNRLYTHEIVPAQLSIDKLPTRLGYVIRCSKTKAVFKDNQTFIKNENGELTKLEDCTPDKIKILKDTYFKENTSDELITYDNTYFSLNQGDYLKPNL